MLYRSPGMQISVVPHEGSSPVRVADFEKSSSGACRDSTRPVVVDIVGAEQSFIAERRTHACDLVRNCTRAGCGSMTSLSGPDGSGTLCSSCGKMHAQKRLVLFQERGTGRLSVVAHQGWTPVTQLEPKNGDVEVTVVPLGDVPKGGILLMGYRASDEKENVDEGDAEGNDWEAGNGLGVGEGEDVDQMDITIDAVDEDDGVDSVDGVDGVDGEASIGRGPQESLPYQVKAENAVDVTVD